MSKRLHILALGLVCAGACMTGKGIYMGMKAYTSQILLGQAWEKTMQTGVPALPWSSMDATLVAQIVVPNLNKSAIVLSEASGQALAFGPAHMRQTPLPGQSGLSVIAAHKNTHFAFLKDMRKGDVIQITGTDGKMREFEMTNAEIVHKDQFNVSIPNGSDALKRVALVTCYPFNAVSYGGPMRYVVFADHVN